jgi:hypothetical protein
MDRKTKSVKVKIDILNITFVLNNYVISKNFILKGTNLFCIANKEEVDIFPELKDIDYLAVSPILRNRLSVFFISK